MPANECFICQKHKNLSEFTGEVIAQKGGLLLTHFPNLKDEKATRGHLLIEPKRHVTKLTELSDEECNALGGFIRLGASLMEGLLKAEHVYVFRINDKVAHFHIHLIPRYAGTPREFWGAKIMEWPGRKTVTLEEIRNVSRDLRQAAQV